MHRTVVRGVATRPLLCGLIAAVTAACLVPANAVSSRQTGPARRAQSAQSGRDPVEHGVDPWRLTATTFARAYAPAYVGNGFLGTRVPAEGEGYDTAPVQTETHVAGLYDQSADTRGVPLPPGEVTAMPVAAPQWSGLEFGDGSGTWSTQTGQVRRYRQTLDLRTATITTDVTWRGPGGHLTDLRYRLFLSRSRLHVGVVQLRITPHWTGRATVRDVLGPGGGVLVGGAQPTPLSPLPDAPDAAARTNRYAATTRDGSATIAETSHLLLSRGSHPTVSATTGNERNVIAAAFPVQRGHSYTVAKVAAIATAVGSTGTPARLADRDAARAAAVGVRVLRHEHVAAWRRLWRSRIDVLGDPALAQVVHASEFYLLASFDRRVRWSASPAGLSSGGYNGHIFWDAETWMYPALLATHPDIAAAVDAYRQRLLPAARTYAAAGGYRGARFPWESARSGGEESPPPWSAFEQHISADISLAQWQYYLATGDRAWLARRAYPLLAAVADFWVSRAVHTTAGYQLLGMMGPDEYNYPVDNSTYTNVAARTALRIALRAARLLHRPTPASWRTVADGIVVPFDPAAGIHPEYDGYQGGGIKQADTVMLAYPWGAAESRRVAAADLAYYMPRTDPGGPSMTDSIHAIDTLALHLRGCAAYTLMRRSMDPFLRPPFDQFAETRAGGAFTFLTGTGGFLQEFDYGFSGLRWRSDALHLDPQLPPQLRGVVLRRLHWHGREITVRITHPLSTVTIDRGAAATVATPGGRHRVAPGQVLRLTTADPAHAGSASLLQCQPTMATGTTGGSYPFAATDGSTGTTWAASAPVSTLTVRLPRLTSVHSMTARWAETTKTSSTYVGPPIQTTSQVDRPSSYQVLVSQDGRHWRIAATEPAVAGPYGPQVVDRLRIGGRPVLWVRLRCQVPSAGIALAELRASS